MVANPVKKNKQQLIDELQQALQRNEELRKALHGGMDRPLLSQEDFSQQMISDLPHAVFLIDAKDYRVLFAKQPDSAIETTNAKLCYQAVYHRDQPCSGSECPCVLKRALHTKKMVVQEHRHVGEDGKIRFYDVYGYPLLNAQGEVTQLIEYPMETTDRRSAEKQSVIDRVRYQKIFNAATEGIVIIDSTDTILDANPKACKMFGYTLEEIKQIQGKQLAPPEYLDSVRKSIMEMLETGESFTEIEGLRKDGSRFDLEIQGTLFEEGDIPRMLGHLRDVTKRNQAQREARISQRQYQNVFNAATDGLIIMDEGDIIADVNPQMCKLFGYSRKEFLQMHGKDLVPSSEHRAFRKIGKAVRSSGRFNLETTGLRKDGSTFDIDVQGTRFFSTSEQQMLGIFRDITERKKNERALQSREQELLEQAQHLQDANAALKVLLQRRDDDRREIEELLLANLKALVLPHLESIKETSLTARQQGFLEMLEINLMKIVAPFLQNLKTKVYNLTPAEIKVVDLIKEGKRTKEIADIMGLSKRTIDAYRYNIRKKLDLDDKTPLNRYLLTLQ